MEISPIILKDGSELTFKIHEKSPDAGDQQMFPWVVHKIEAIINSKIIGYIKLSYIPEKNIKLAFPTLFDFAVQEGKGWYRNFKDLPLINQIERLNSDVHLYNFYSIKDKPESELIEIKKELVKEFNKRMLPKFKKFVRFQQDKPIVDYILVDDEYKRKGIGEALYVLASKFLATKNLKLHASGLQSDAAKASWENLKTKYADKIGIYKDRLNKRDRTYLSHLQEEINKLKQLLS